MGVHLRTDGTFHLTRPLRYIRGIRNGFSYDLKAATDSLPVVLSPDLLGAQFGNHLAEEWDVHAPPFRALVWEAKREEGERCMVYPWAAARVLQLLAYVHTDASYAGVAVG
jgi:hypothetical protein